ncbi:MAG: hypothetical protein V7K27_05730 [Nostoc sp.]|uniref:hypothetical protein n=1 Tax=Nostoc sp. TaxID=1180 RepID=UPI002FF93A71
MNLESFPVFLKDKKIPVISNSAPSKGVELTNVDFSVSNIVRLKSILSFFSYLNINGKISDEAFEVLVRYACSIFIENEIEARVKDVFEQKIKNFWESKLSSALEKYITTK